MTNILYIKPDKTKTYYINSEEEFNYYKSLRPSRLWDRMHFKFKCSECFKEKELLLLNLKFPFICRNCHCKIIANKESTKHQRRETCKKRYGVENCFQSKEMKEKIKETNILKYGVEHPAQNKTIMSKIQQTNLKKYGTTCSLNSETSIIKKKETWIKHYGVDNPNKCENVVKKREQTNIKKYGTKYYTQTDEYKQKSFLTKLDKYGDPFYSGNILYHYDNIYFRSKPELCFYIYNKDLNKTIIYEPKPYLEYGYNGKKHFYKPDFLVENVFYEIKGDHFFNKDNKLIDPYDRSQDDLYEAKQKCMIENNVIILKSGQYNFYLKYVKEKYGINFTEQFKYKK